MKSYVTPKNSDQSSNVLGTGPDATQILCSRSREALASEEMDSIVTLSRLNLKKSLRLDACDYSSTQTALKCRPKLHSFQQKIRIKKETMRTRLNTVQYNGLG